METRELTNRQTGNMALLRSVLWNSELQQYDYWVIVCPNDPEDKTTIMYNVGEFVDLYTLNH